MNKIVKRFFVLALPMLMAGSLSEKGYSIQIENNSGIELSEVSIEGATSEFSFGELARGDKSRIGHADIQFAKTLPEQLNIQFTPRYGGDTIKKTIDLPNLDGGEAISLKIGSYLDLINRSNISKKDSA